ncbi:hypothetical protein Agub_g10582, partial [Astrephomene gubernaculifera]
RPIIIAGCSCNPSASGREEMAALRKGLGLPRECSQQQWTARPGFLFSRFHVATPFGGARRAVCSRASREQQLLQELLDLMKKTNNKVGKLSKQVQRLEARVCEMYEFTSLPLISGHFGNDFADSVDLRSAAHIVDHILNLALNLDLNGLKQRGVLINALEEYVLKDRQGLRAAVRALIDEACEEAGVCMIAPPSNFQTASWDDIRAVLQELQHGFSAPAAASSGHLLSEGGGGAEERITNLLRLLDALEAAERTRAAAAAAAAAAASSAASSSSSIRSSALAAATVGGSSGGVSSSSSSSLNGLGSGSGSGSGSLGGGASSSGSALAGLPRPLPAFMEMATALAGANRGCASRVALDCRGRIDVRETFIEFHFGAFKGVNSGLPETCQQLRRAARLFVWAYRVLEPHLQAPHAGAAGAAARQQQQLLLTQPPPQRDVAAIGYAFTLGKAPPHDSLLKLYDEFEVEVGGVRREADIAYRYFSVRPTGLHEHHARA